MVDISTLSTGIDLAERRADAINVFSAGVASDISTLFNDILQRAPAADIGSDLCFKVCDDAEGSDNLIPFRIAGQSRPRKRRHMGVDCSKDLVGGTAWWYATIVRSMHCDSPSSLSKGCLSHQRFAGHSI